jgi:hypothetical protein
MAIRPAMRDTSRVMFCNHTWVELKKETIKVTNETMALVEPTSALDTTWLLIAK